MNAWTRLSFFSCKVTKLALPPRRLGCKATTGADTSGKSFRSESIFGATDASNPGHSNYWIPNAQLVSLDEILLCAIASFPLDFEESSE